MVKGAFLEPEKSQHFECPWPCNDVQPLVRKEYLNISWNTKIQRTYFFTEYFFLDKRDLNALRLPRNQNVFSLKCLVKFPKGNLRYDNAEYGSTFGDCFVPF